MKLCKKSRESWRETTNTNHPLREESFLKTLPTRVHFTIEEKNVTVDFSFCLIPVLSELTQHRLFELLSQGFSSLQGKEKRKSLETKLSVISLLFTLSFLMTVFIPSLLLAVHS